MLNGNIEFGVTTRVTAAATGVIVCGASANGVLTNIALLGILVGSVGTAPTVNIWHGQVTAAGATMIGTITCAANAFTRIPAYGSGGATLYFSSITTPDCTIFWNPLA